MTSCTAVWYSLRGFRSFFKYVLNVSADSFSVCVQSQMPLRWRRAKEIKDSSNLQAVPNILVLKKWHCLVPHWLRFLLFLQYSIACMTSLAELALSNALRFSKIQDQGKLTTACLYKQSTPCMMPPGTAAGNTVSSLNTNRTYFF